MQQFCAFLRGINVNGTTMKMADVCQVFEDAGMQNVTSVLATGNINFSSDQNRLDLKLTLEKALSNYFNYEAFLFLKSKSEVISMFESKVFQQEKDLHLYVFIGNENIENTLLKEFELSTKSEQENAKVVNSVLYWQVQKGNTSSSSFGKVLGKKSLKDQFTSRNFNTLEKIVKKFQY